ncbi:MAG: hypothetical protein EAZ61_05950 [Oscillatoriales cyanobacterium]|jgi:hypothetical protein|nr:MAG: hypothetical protein EAZ61_05950 [Oscillatoriales cyanobacterium]
MQDKQKVTLYLSQELHRDLKVRAAIDGEPMSSLAERALLFYLEHPEAIAELESSIGRNHRLYHCPDCSTPVVIRDDELVSVASVSSLLEDEATDDLTIRPRVDRSAGEGNLVPC